MKKKILSILLFFALSVSLVGCTYSEMDATYNEAAEELPPSMFVKVEEGMNYTVVYCKETKVMYAIGYGAGVFTLLVDENGNPMIYKGE